MKHSLPFLQRVVGATAAYVALLCIVSQAWVLLGVGLVMGSAATLAAGRVADRRRDTPGSDFFGRLPLPIIALVVWPIISLLLVIPVSVAAGNPLSDLPLELVAPVIGVAAVGGGLVAAARGVDSSTHGWWALGAGLVSVVLFAGVVAV